jgi:hypothetical protein
MAARSYSTSRSSFITTLAISVHVPYPRRDIHGNVSFPWQFLEFVARLTILPTPDYAQDRNLQGVVVRFCRGPFFQSSRY